MFPIRDHNPSPHKPWVTWGLLISNCAIFLLTWPAFANDREALEFFFHWGMVPALISEGQSYGGIVTSMFLHAGWLHLLGNMLFLWIFGDNLEEEMGHLRFLLFYLACGAAAALIQYAAEPQSYSPMVGASGAIAGVLGGYLLLYPRAQVDVFFYFLIFFRIIPVPAWIVLLIWFGMQLVGGFSMPSDQGGVAYWAHAGGYVVGLLLVVPLWLRLGGPRFWRESDGAPANPPAPPETFARSHIPVVRRRK